MSNTAKHFDIRAINLNVLRNYFDGPNKIIFRFVNKFLDISANRFFYI